MEFDYVIIGGGSAGAVLAARLAEDARARVCLIEAGGAGRNLLIRVPLGIVALVPGRPPIANWALWTEPQPGLGGRRGFQPRGRALGGSSAINAMLYLRGHRDDYDGWEAMGARGWGWQDVLPWFIRAEGNARGADDFHGADGPLQVTDQQAPRAISRDFVAAAREWGLPERDDFNRGETEGAGLYQVTQFHDDRRRGERCSAAAAWLRPRDNLHIMTRTRAQRIVFEGKRAVGVELRSTRGRQVVRARREVIVSAGAFHSPQLLQLSGVGPAGDLRRLGIAVVQDLPGVGANLHDHIDFTLSWRSRVPDMFGVGLGPGLKLARAARRWRRDGRSMLASPVAEAGAFLRLDPGLARPDLQLHFVIGIVDRHGRRLHRGYGFGCHVCVLYPKSRGRVFLRDANPASAPAIDPAFLSDPQDLQVLIRGAKITRRIMLSAPLARYRHRELFGLHDAMSDDDWARHIRARADTIYHPVGTCRMGEDPGAVVDSRLRVHGVEGLRVVDASVMPRITGGNTNAPTIMIAERAAAMIAG